MCSDINVFVEHIFCMFECNIKNQFYPACNCTARLVIIQILAVENKFVQIGQGICGTEPVFSNLYEPLYSIVRHGLL